MLMPWGPSSKYTEVYARPERPEDCSQDKPVPRGLLAVHLSTMTAEVLCCVLTGFVYEDDEY